MCNCPEKRFRTIEIDVSFWMARCGVAVTVFEERSNALVYLACHYGSVVLAVHGVFATRRLVLVMFIDARAFLVEVWQNIGYVGSESPWLLEENV